MSHRKVRGSFVDLVAIIRRGRWCNVPFWQPILPRFCWKKSANGDQKDQRSSHRCSNRSSMAMARTGSCWILEATCKAHGAGDHNRFCWLRKGGLTWAQNLFESHCWVPLLGINNSHPWLIFFRRPSTSSAFALSGWTRNLPECRKNVKAGCRCWKNTLGCCVGYWSHLFCSRIAVLYLNVLLHLVIELQWKKNYIQ